MTTAVPFIVAGIAGFGASKLVTAITGNETLGMIAGIAAGGWAGSVANAPGAAAGGAAGGTPTADAGAGATGAGAESALSTNYLPLPSQSAGTLGGGTGGGLLTSSSGITPAATSSGISSGAAGTTGASTAAGAATPAAAGGTQGLLSKIGLSATDAWNMGGNIAKGYAEGKYQDRMMDRYDEQNQLMRDKFEQEKKERDEQTAYGVPRVGAPTQLNIAGQLQEVQANSALSNMNQLGAVQRPEDGYLAGYGRFMRPEEEKTA